MVLRELSPEVNQNNLDHDHLPIILMEVYPMQCLYLSNPISNKPVNMKKKIENIINGHTQPVRIVLKLLIGREMK